MFEHFIIMASSYRKGTRIAFQYVYCGGVDQNEIQEAIRTIENVGGGEMTFSTHYVCTESKEWDSVVSYDPFFADVYVAGTLEEMLFILKKDMQLSGLDIAKYILSRRKCTHLELEKLTYLCYADYLCKYRKRLCEDVIYAFAWGPVIDSVYERYSRHKEVLGGDLEEAITRSRILLLPDGVERISSIEESLWKYRNCTAYDMVEITHAKGSPWDTKDASKHYQIIGDDLILERHSIEEKYFDEKFGNTVD